MTVQFHLFEEAGVAAQALTDAVRGDLQQALQTAPRALLLVSGGRRLQGPVVSFKLSVQIS